MRSSLPDRITFEPEFNLRWFDLVPGFELLYATWSDIFSAKRDPKLGMNAGKALEMWGQAEDSIKQEYGYGPDTIRHLSGLAFKYAMYLPQELEEEIRDL